MLNKFDQLALDRKTTGKAPREHIDNTQLLKDTGLRVRHIRSTVNGLNSSSTRDVTIAFRDGNNVLEIATSVVNPVDCFSRKVGTKLAVENFLAGKTVRVPKVLDMYGRKASAITSLNFMFGALP